MLALACWDFLDPKPEPCSRVYFFICGDLVKIGKSVDPWRRLREVNNGSPHEIFYCGSIAGWTREEQLLHHIFKSYRVRGEWFKINKFLHEFIEKRAEFEP